ncbi:hypothetical protein AOLI_G00282750 [Acnodon oligacanthus]
MQTQLLPDGLSAGVSSTSSFTVQCRPLWGQEEFIKTDQINGARGEIKWNRRRQRETQSALLLLSDLHAEEPGEPIGSVTPALFISASPGKQTDEPELRRRQNNPPDRRALRYADLRAALCPHCDLS